MHKGVAGGIRNVPKHTGCMVTMPIVLYQPACRQGEEIMCRSASSLLNHHVTLCDHPLSQAPKGLRASPKTVLGSN